MSETDSTPQPADRCRLTIFDLLLLTFSYALGFGISRWVASTPDALELIAGGLLFGGGFAVPMAVISQWAMGRRKIAPSLGELLGMATLMNWTIVIVGTQYWADGVVIPPALWSQCLCSVAAVSLPIIRLVTNWRGVSCRWTDLFGCLNCVLFALLIIYALARTNPAEL